MDINDIRSILTVLAFATFMGIVVWAYSRRRRAAFDEAANLPFTEDELPGAARQRKEGKAS
ncbi:MAG: cbb3-type cytochrome c oxidase subunit 3 [Betaproteobacteria bacterium]|jgi:cytochrome c oxidase cbb3-type subunit 4|nr:cbb3-type cytochrome c oxidase subunit 3 [Betaproteobacteria bacterium]